MEHPIYRVKQEAQSLLEHVGYEASEALETVLSWSDEILLTFVTLSIVGGVTYAIKQLIIAGEEMLYPTESE